MPASHQIIPWSSPRTPRYVPAAKRSSAGYRSAHGSSVSLRQLPTRSGVALVDSDIRVPPSRVVVGHGKESRPARVIVPDRAHRPAKAQASTDLGLHRPGGETGGLAPVGDELGAGAEARLVRRKEEDQVGQLHRLTDAAEGDVALGALQALG